MNIFILLYCTCMSFFSFVTQIKVREYLGGNKEWTIQRETGNIGYTGRRKTKHRKLIKWATQTPPKIEGEHRPLWRTSSHCLSQDTRHVTQSICIGHHYTEMGARSWVTARTFLKEKNWYENKQDRQWNLP